MFMNNNKRKKHPLLAMAVGGLAIFGAYSMVCCAKNAALTCKDKMSHMMSGKKKNGCAPDLSTMMKDCDS
jgi:hypothetical protein